MVRWYFLQYSVAMHKLYQVVQQGTSTHYTLEMSLKVTNTPPTVVLITNLFEEILKGQNSLQ